MRSGLRTRASSVLVALCALALPPWVAAENEPTTATPPAAVDSAPKAPAARPTGRGAVDSGRLSKQLGIDLSGGEDLDLRSDTVDVIELPNGRRGMRFKGNVRLVQGELRATCDRLDGIYREDGVGGFDTITGVGNFVLIQEDLELRCERVVYDADACLVHCESTEPCGSAQWPARPATIKRADGTQLESRVLDYNLCTAKLTASCGVRSVFRGKPSSAVKPAATAKPAATTKPAATAKPAPTSKPVAGQSPTAAPRPTDPPADDREEER